MVNGLPGIHNQVSAALPKLYPTPVSQYDPNPQPEPGEEDQDVQQSPVTPSNARTSSRKGDYRSTHTHHVREIGIELYNSLV